MIINSVLDVNITTRNIGFFREKGYNPQLNSVLSVCTEDLSDGSHLIETRSCDNCGEVFSKTHQSFVRARKIYNNLDICPKCALSGEFLQRKTLKTKETNLQRYQVEVPLQSEQIKNKQHETMKSRYGVEYAILNNELRQKINNTNLKKYGVENPLKSPEIFNKGRQTLLNNGNVPTSSQQIQIYNDLKLLYPEADIQLNYSYSNLFLDVFFLINDVKIDIEYDAHFWHMDEKYDRKRDEFLKSRGFKILRIRSGHYLPLQDELCAKIESLLEQPELKFSQIILQDW